MEFNKLVDFLSSRDSYVVILRGLSGSGKTTLANKLAAKLEKESKILSLDDFFTAETGEYRFDATKLQKAHDELLGRFLDELEEATPFIFVDSPAIRVFEIAPYVALASSYGHPHGIVTVHCDPWDAIRRNRKKITDTKILEQAQEMANQSFPTWWHRFEILNGNGNRSSKETLP